MLAALEPLIAHERPDAVLVYGDTNSTLAGALAGAQAGVPVVHVEAGMRSFDRSMPEELNRVLSDHLRELLLCPSRDARPRTCGRARRWARCVVVGDVMVDVALRWQEHGREDPGARRARPPEPVTTAGDRAPGRERRPPRAPGAPRGAGAGRARAGRVPRCIPAPASGCGRAGLIERLRGATASPSREPLGYLDFAALLIHARAVLSDSGGPEGGLPGRCPAA